MNSKKSYAESLPLHALTTSSYSGNYLKIDLSYNDIFLVISERPLPSNLKDIEMSFIRRYHTLRVVEVKICWWY